MYGGYWLGRKFRLAHPGPNLRMAALAAHAIGAALAILVLVFSFYLFVTQPEQIGDTLARVQFVGVVLLECWFLYGLGRGLVSCWAVETVHLKQPVRRWGFFLSPAPSPRLRSRMEGPDRHANYEREVLSIFARLGRHQVTLPVIPALRNPR